MPSRQPLSVVVLPPHLEAVAESQRGIFSGEQARAAGYTSKEIQRLRVAGQLTSVRRGVYAQTASWRSLDPVARHLAELLALRLVLTEPAVISHVSAGVIHGLSLLTPELQTLHVTRPGVSASRQEAGIHHHVCALPETHIVELDGWRVTSLARTSIDIARESSLPEAVAVLDSALRLGLPPRELTEMFLSCRNWPGARTAARALTFADGRAANAGESWSRVELARLGVAPTEIQRTLYDEDGLVGIADFVWDPQRVVGEFDGRLKYNVAEGSSGADAAEILWTEKRREDRIRGLGYEVVRWVYADLFQPERLAARVRQALARGEARRRTSA